MNSLAIIVSLALTIIPVFGITSPDAPARKKEYFVNMVLIDIDLEKVNLESFMDVVRSRAFVHDHEKHNTHQGGFMMHPLPQELETIKISYFSKKITLYKLLKVVAKEANLDLYLTSKGLIFCKIGTTPRHKKMEDKVVVWGTIHKHQKPQETNQSEQGASPNR
jgi:hypothetical protein